jgi:Uma2 family endonuclease
MSEEIAMTTATTQELLGHPVLLYRHTVEEYHRMIAEGILEEGAPFELLNGQVVRKIRSATGENPMTMNPRHVTVVARLGDLNGKLKRLGCHLRTQSPISLPPLDEPEPDGAVVRGKIADYEKRHPGADDALCIIEVADASLVLDRRYKQQLYANSGIATYVIINLVDRVVELYTQPMKGKGRYAQVATLGGKQTLSIPTTVGKGLNVPIKRLLP